MMNFDKFRKWRCFVNGYFQHRNTFISRDGYRSIYRKWDLKGNSFEE